MRRTKAFTLIELLVVISIISLIASVVLASLNTSREKGRLGAGKYFASQVDHVAGEQAIGLWELNECTGTLAADRSGFGNDGTLVATSSWSSDSPLSTGCSTHLVSAGNQTITINSKSELRSITQEMTVAAWVKYGSYQLYNFAFSDANDVGNIGGVLVGSYSNEARPRFTIWGPSGATTLLGAKQFQLNVWYHLVATYDGSKMRLYVDGVLDSSLSYSGGISPAQINAAIGGLSGYPQGGKDIYTDSVRVYAKALTGIAVGKLYVDGFKTHQFASSLAK